jgi:hypothetical protein
MATKKAAEKVLQEEAATEARKELAIVKGFSGEVTTEELPQYLRNQQGRGNENISRDDLLVPRIELVQPLSKIKESNPEIKDGDLINSVTGEIIGDVAYFCPVYYQMEHIVWKSQNEGGGFFGSFRTMGEAEAARVEVISQGNKPEHIEVVDTPVHFGFLVDPDTHKTQQIVISMAKSKMKVSRKWNSIIQICGGDRFSRIYKITSVSDKNAKGQPYKNFVVSPAGFAPESVYREAEEVYKTFALGEIKADHASNAAAGRDELDRGEV